MMRLGFIKYINALPFLLPFQKGKVALPFRHTFTISIPTRLNKLLENCELDVALTSSLSALQAKRFHLPNFCIAASNKVESVNLYVQNEIHHIKHIGVTEESATSVALLRVLCHHFWQITPSFEIMQPGCQYEAFLLIGDQALKNKHIVNYQTLDLAAIWKKMTNLPFVFALFVVRAQYASRLYELTLLQQALAQALTWSQSHPEIVQHQAPNYFKNLHYQMGKKEEESLLLFSRLWKQTYGF